MEIIYAGATHYGAGAYRSLQKYFDLVYLIKDNPEDVFAEKRNCDEVIDDFDSVGCRYVFLGGYAKLITADQLTRKIYINVHGALLPKWRGMHTTFWSIMNGDKELGVTFHLVNEYMDDGDIIGQFKFSYHGQTVQEVNNAIDSLIEENAGRIVSGYINGKIQPVPQDRSQATFGARRNYDDCLIDFTMTNEMLSRYFMALTRPYPLPMLMIRGEKYEVLDHEIIARDYYGPVGRAVNIDDYGVWIKTSEGFLVVREVQKFGTDEKIKLKDIIMTGYRFKQ